MDTPENRIKFQLEHLSQHAFNDRIPELNALQHFILHYMTMINPGLVYDY